MGADILSIGRSGLMAAQRQLQTTSHNVSNVNTEGYSRQRVEQEAIIPAYYAGRSGYIGTGVTVQTTVRLANEFLEEQVRNGNSRYGQHDSFYALSAQIDNILANPSTGLTPTLEGFYSALQEANDAPSSTPARQVLLTEANVLTDRFQVINDRFIELNNEVNGQLIVLSSEISTIASSIASINLDIVERIGAGQGNMPNDLMDQREALIKDLSTMVDVSVVYQDDGAINVFIGSGQTLVLGGTPSRISTEINKYDSSKLDIILHQGNGSENISGFISGGELEGILDFRNEVLQPSVNSLGRIAIAISEEMNAQHKLGMTIQGTTDPFPLGGDFFTSLTGTPQVLDGQLGSSGDYTAAITDSKILTTSDYLLKFDGTNYTLTRLNDGKLFTDTVFANLNTAVTAAEGFSLVENTAAAAGESFLIQPTAMASSLIGVKVNNVLDIALASPVVAGEVTSATGGAVNTGTGQISLPTIKNITDPPPSPVLAADIILTFDSGIPGFTGGPVTPIAYNPATDFGGKEFTFSDPGGPPGYGDITFTISGVPNNLDQFVIGNNTSPFDDNRNGLLLAQLQIEKSMENGSSNFQAAYGLLVADVGNKTHAAEIDLKAQLTLLEEAKAIRESYSGVNLDEEAAQLLRFQQAYQASSKVISSANEMFQSLLNAL